MGFCYSTQLDDRAKRRTIFRCGNCSSHLFTSTNIVSDNFTGRKGQGFLVNKVVNYKAGDIQRKTMMTGDYNVCDTMCQHCGQYLGWKYLKAWISTEKYKEGQFVMEQPQLNSGSAKRLEKGLL